LLQAETYGNHIKDKKIEWPESKKQYIEEIKNNHQTNQLLQTLSAFVNDYKDKNNHIQQEEILPEKINFIQKYDTITFLCHYKDENHCHMSIVKDIRSLA